MTWEDHITKLQEKLHKNADILKRLPGEKWGSTLDTGTLNKTYKVYLKPKLIYGSEELVIAKDTTINKIEIIENQMLRLFTGAVKSRNVTAMRIFAGNPSIKKEIEKKACMTCMKLVALPEALPGLKVRPDLNEHALNDDACANVDGACNAYKVLTRSSERAWPEPNAVGLVPSLKGNILCMRAQFGRQ